MAEMIFDQMTALAACLCEQLGELDAPGLCFCGVFVGSEPYDASGIGDCEDDACGQAWVRLASGYPSTAVGVADATPENCQKGFGYDVEMGVLRCISIEEDGGVMDPADMLAAVNQQIEDMMAMRRALLCCDAIESSVMGLYTPVGPDGGLVGGTWLVSIGMDI